MDYTPSETVRQLVTAGIAVAQGADIDDVRDLTPPVDDSHTAEVVAGLAVAAGLAVEAAAQRFAATLTSTDRDPATILAAARDTFRREVLAAMDVWLDGPQAP